MKLGVALGNIKFSVLAPNCGVRVKNGEALSYFVRLALFGDCEITFGIFGLEE